MSLKRQAVSGMLWTYLQQFSSQFISFGVSIVLARVILPAEFGLVGMLAVFMGIGMALFDGGLTSSLIRAKDLSEEDYSTVFYFNLACSILIYGILFFSAPYIAIFYGQPNLTNITRIYGFTFILSAFGTVQNTILTRELKFRKQAIIAFPALLISSIVGLLLAYKDFGVWSLVIAALANSFFTSLFLWISSSWSPKWVFNVEKFHVHFNYGYKLTLSSVLDIIFTNIYQIIIGRYYSPSEVGYYARANSLLMLPVGNISGALNRVVFPLFSKIQDDMPKFRDAYKKIMLMVLFIISPIIVLMALMANPLIIFLFTDRWLPIVPIFQIICFTGILYPIHMYNLLVLQVKGRSDLFLKLELIKKIIQALILFITFFYGFYALLWGQLIFSILALLINTYYAGQMLSYKMLDQLRDIVPIFMFSVVMGMVVYSVITMLESQSNFLKLFAGSLSGAFSYLLVAWIFKFQTINDVKNLILKK